MSIVVEHGSAEAIPVDVLALKHADALYGVDRIIASALSTSSPDILRHLPRQGEIYLAPSMGAIQANRVLFVGVGPLYEFSYGEIRAFSRRVLETAEGEVPDARHIALTIHGPGYGLDEREAFRCEIAGLLDAISVGDYPPKLRKITIVEANAGRASRLTVLLDELLAPKIIPERAEPASPIGREPNGFRGAGNESRSKPHVFVAMPFAEQMDDVFHYGIQGAVNAAGFLCERADLSTFTGDVIEWVKQRISTASLVVADLSDSNPNVYLEVGFAWGCGRPTVLLINDSAQLKFNVKGQRCLVYKKIKDLEGSLREELSRLKSATIRR